MLIDGYFLIGKTIMQITSFQVELKKGTSLSCVRVRKMAQETFGTSNNDSKIGILLLRRCGWCG